MQIKKLFLLVVGFIFNFNVFALVDNDATVETVNLYNSLLKKEQILIGQIGVYSTSNPEYGQPFKDISGKFPKILHLMYDEKRWDRFSIYGHGSISEIYLQFAKQHVARGGIIMLSGVPWNFSETAIGDADTVNIGDDKDETGSPITDMMENGQNRQEYLDYMEEFALFLKNFTDENGNLIPVILRPYQEQDGNWFWWGTDSCTDEQFVQLWQDFVYVMRDLNAVHNVLYCICPEAFKYDCYTGDRYPGDDYVDIIGIDVYTNSNDLNAIDWTGRTPIVGWRRAAQAGFNKGKPWGIVEGVRSQGNSEYFREDYWTWLMNQWLSDSLINTASFYCFWESNMWGPENGRADAENFALLADYPQLGWLEPQKAKIKNAFIKENN